jgi:hypothetical protein
MYNAAPAASPRPPLGQPDRQAEVRQQHFIPVFVPEQVGRRDVPVDDPKGVNVQQRLRHVGNVACRLPPAQRTLGLQPGLERAARDILHHQVVLLAR